MPRRWLPGSGMSKASELSKRLSQVARFAALFTSGTTAQRGNAFACNSVLGTDFALDDIDVARAIAEANGETSQQPGVSQVAMPRNVAVDWRTKLEEAPKQEGDWCRKAKELEDVAKGIAEGTVKATAAQAALIKAIDDRCYGKVQEKQSDKTPASGVILLPMLGDGMHSQICPRCGFDAGKEANESL